MRRALRNGRAWRSQHSAPEELERYVEELFLRSIVITKVCTLNLYDAAVYGQRNRQKVAEDEESHREKEEAEQKQRSKGDREVRLQVLRRQAGVEVRWAAGWLTFVAVGTVRM